MDQYQRIYRKEVQNLIKRTIVERWGTEVRIGTNLGLFKISFSTFWLAEPKCTETDLKPTQIC